MKKIGDGKIFYKIARLSLIMEGNPVTRQILKGLLEKVEKLEEAKK